MKYANISIEKGFTQTALRNNNQRIINFGDYIQIIAIDRLYELMGIKDDIIYIEYYDLLDYDGDDVILPINFIFFNPFFGNRELLLSPKIHPIMLGIHKISEGTENEIEYLKGLEPIGCRDIITYCLLKEIGVDSYFQGCLSLTFPQRDTTEKQNKIYLVDIPESLKEYMPIKIKTEGIEMSNVFYGDAEDLLYNKNKVSIKEYVLSLLDLYRDTASLVVTSRLHIAAPCSAMGIPVILTISKQVNSMSWMSKICPIYYFTEFDKIDWNPHAKDFELLKQNMIELAITRVRDNKINHKCISYISNFYGDTIFEENSNEYLVALQKYAKQYGWDRSRKIKYAIWGVTQISDIVCDYMDKEYPYSILVAVVDEYRDIIYRNMHSIRLCQLSDDYDVLITTGNSTSYAAFEYQGDIINKTKLVSVLTVHCK